MRAISPKVSIIMPVYNGSDYLREAIDSALSQTYSGIEVIVVNDGSNDNGKTEQIALSYGDQIHYFSKPNGGVATALNLGIEKMTGEYFSWLSHDDVYYPEKIERQIACLAQQESSDVILYSNYRVIDAQSKNVAECILDHEMLVQKPLYAILRGAIHGCSLLIPRRAFDTCGTFDVNLRTTQDYDLWFKMRHKYKFVHIPETLIKSRSHPEQDTHKNPRTLIEANALWIGFMDTLSDDEILACEESKYEFFNGLSVFLETSPYEEALIYCKKKTDMESAFPLLHLTVRKIKNSKFIRKNRVIYHLLRTPYRLVRSVKNFVCR